MVLASTTTTVLIDAGYIRLRPGTNDPIQLRELDAIQAE